MIPFEMHRLGTLITPEPGNPNEVEGVLNPAAARGRDGELYLFPRMVAKNNYSRIGMARVLFNAEGDPVGVDRMGIALEPQADYELRGDGGGGCEDPRVTYVEPFGHYVMTYTAFSRNGPRIALAVSDDLMKWERLGLASFEPYKGIEFDDVDNKDASIFPLGVPDPSGEPAFAILHRPLFAGTRPEEKVADPGAEEDLHLESIWISYRDIVLKEGQSRRHFTSHRRLAAPEASWEKLKIGCGAPPVLTRLGWMMLYHGVSDVSKPGSTKSHLRYSAGVMILAEKSPSTILYRSPHPVLTPKLPEERLGLVSDVVFPTGVDCRDDIGQPDRFDVYYGMADDKIGVARLDLPKELPPNKAGP